jgi:hypothetical protein
MYRTQKKVGIWPCTTKWAGFNVAPAHLPLQSTSQKLFSIFFQNPLARNGTMWYHYGVSKTRLGSQLALEGWRDAQ